MTGQFPILPTRIATTLASIFEAQGQRQIAEILKAATATVEETGYDNWDGGSYYYALHLELPISQYARVEPNLNDTEQAIAGKLKSALRTTGSDILNSVVITPIFDPQGPDATGSVPDEDIGRLWTPGMFRLFLSHVSAHKVAVSNLKRDLRVYGVSGFVAHEDIEPSLEWQAEIEVALWSMQAMAALLTPEFHESKWTDQEIGIAVGRGAIVLPVRLPLGPYGFVAKHQGLRGDLANPSALASAVVDILLRRERTAEAMREGLIVALESSKAFAASRLVATKIESAGAWTVGQLGRIDASLTANPQVANSYGVPERLHRLVASAGDLGDSATRGVGRSPTSGSDTELDDLPF